MTEETPLEGGNKQEQRRLTVREDNPSCGIFIFKGEDHTLGNALRYMAMRNKDVAFAGYSIPHPFDDEVHLRIQTNNGVPAMTALETALSDLRNVSEHILEVFQQRIQEFKSIDE